MRARDYQRDALAHLLETSAGGLYVAPTGSGKTFVALELAGAELARGAAAVRVVVPWRDLARQWHAAAIDLGAQVQLCEGGRLQGPPAPIVVTTQSSAHRAPAADVAIVDEVHRFSDPARVGGAARVYGLTATPTRRGAPIWDYGPIVLGPSPDALCRRGYLRRPHYLERSPRQLTARTVVYTATIAHAEQWAERGRAAGLRAAAVSHRTPIAVRRRLVSEFVVGDLDLIANVGMLLEGFDARPAHVVIARRCGPTPWAQIVGRGMRPANVELTVWDAGRNRERWGCPTRWAWPPWEGATARDVDGLGHRARLRR